MKRNCMKQNRHRMRYIAWSLSVVLLLTALGGCGRKQDSQPGGKKADGAGASAKTAVWVPEYVSLSGEGIGYGSMRVDGDKLYFVEESRDEETDSLCQTIASIALSDNAKDCALAPEDWKTDAESGAFRRCETFFRTAEGGFVTLEGVYPEYPDPADENKNPVGYYLCRYDAGGQRQDERDLTDKMAVEGREGLFWKAAMDGEGRFYFVMHSGCVHLADAEGNYNGVIPPGGAEIWIPDICAGKSGKVYIAQYESAGSDGPYAIKELDFEKRGVGAVCRNYPGSIAKIGMAPGAEQELLLYDGTTLYGYDTQRQSAEKLLDWLDGNVGGDNVICVHIMEDGRILAIQREEGGGDIEMAFLTPKKPSEVVEKETITLASYRRDRQYEKVIAEFNKQSDRYHVETKVYLGDYANSAAAYSDADLRLNGDLVSDHTPDMLILDTFNLNVKRFAANGLFEDLKPWLDKSERYSYEDYFPKTLEACTYNGTLVAVPKYFYLHFLAGKAAYLGTKPGWTAAEMIAFADAHPDAALIDHFLQSSFIDMICFYGMGNYVDWVNGECHFDSEEFIRLLELSDRFLKDDADNTVADDEDATPYKLQDGRALLYQDSFSSYYKIQELDAVFGGEEVCCIGFPAGEGSSGVYLGVDTNIAILAKSSHKEGAWAFLEYYLGYEDEGSSLSFFANKKAFEERTQEVFAGERYWTDYKGDKVEKYGWWNFEYDVHTPTREEIDRVLDLLEWAVPEDPCAQEIWKIVREETQPYFQGQKSAQAVAKVIQSRVQVYVDENR